MTTDRLKERAYLVTLSFHAVLLLLLGWKTGLGTSIALAMVFLGSVLAAPVVDGHDCDMTIMTRFKKSGQGGVQNSRLLNQAKQLTVLR